MQLANVGRSQEYQAGVSVNEVIAASCTVNQNHLNPGKKIIRSRMVHL
jgi:hypothetical protein